MKVIKMDFLKLLKTDENARKVFGQRELKIIEKQVQGIRLTQSEKNRLSRDIRKKFEFIQKVSRFKEEFALKKGSEIKKMIAEAKEEVLNDRLHGRIKEILLFGSVVENKLTFRSDIDIAVVFGSITKKEAFLFRARVSGRVSDKIDVQVMNILPEKIKKGIERNHKVLYTKNGK